MARREPPRETVGRTIRKKLFAALLPAAAGGLAGFYYGQYSMDPAAPGSAVLPAMYGTMGAIAGVLTVRIAVLFKQIIQDFLTKDE